MDDHDGLPLRPRGANVGYEVARLDAVDAPHWQLQASTSENNLLAVFSSLEAHVHSSLDGVHWYHGVGKGLVAMAMVELLLRRLDPAVYGPLVAFVAPAHSFLQGLAQQQRKPTVTRLQIPEISPRQSPRASPRPAATSPAALPPKRFIELSKTEVHVLEVAVYLRSVLSLLATNEAKNRASMALPTPPADALQMLRRAKLQLRQKQFFPGLLVAPPARHGAKATTSMNVREANLHQVFSTSILCLHEGIRSIGVHSAELASCAFGLLGDILVAIQDYLSEVAEHRKVHRARIKSLRVRRQELRALLSDLDALAANAAKESIALATVLSSTEAEHAALQRECDWHKTCRDLFSFTLEALHTNASLPPQWLVTEDGASHALAAGSSLWRATDVENIKYLGHLMSLSRSYVHLFLKEETLEPEPRPPLGRRNSINARPTRKSMPERTENLKQHLLNVKAKDNAAAQVVEVEEPVGDVMHRVTHAELLVLSTIQDSLRATEMFTALLHRRQHLLRCDASTQTHGPGGQNAVSLLLAPPMCLCDLVARKLPPVYQSALACLPADAPFVAIGREELLRTIAQLLAAYDEQQHHAMTLSSFVPLYFYVHPKKTSPQVECARFLLSLHHETSGLHVTNLLIVFAALAELGTTALTLPRRGLDALLAARRACLGTAVAKGHANLGSTDVVWVATKDKDAHSGNTLLETVHRAIHANSHLLGVREKQSQTATDKSFVVGLVVEADGVAEVQRTHVVSIQSGLLCIMQAWIEEHHFVFQVLTNVFQAALGRPDGCLAFDEFTTILGFMDPLFTPTRLTSLYMQAAALAEATSGANALGEATAHDLVRVLYGSDLFTESKKHWVYAPPMQLSNQKAFEDGPGGLKAMWKIVRERLLDKLAEFNADQINVALVHTCFERFKKMESVLAESAGAFDTNIVAVAWYAFHFLQQDVAWTAHVITKQQQHKPKKHHAAHGAAQRWDSTRRLANLYEYVTAKDRRGSAQSTLDS
ncbi:hypothetical protein SDRG_06187 [Saprolegnia diclina VS20]|uniref:Uncharacterized protein n=1 Tax=Saprolegnia diclina (strain VS20) TaxID=1156394 RepID=T0S1Y2_SAPDV|nr:hypothetical protein SDRG_06187 [Saprolegnia diclina VS20]EQC36752.1 hypothetical protein SDRG_06187 [Saprolegnia diclina VS20]|eukprot:XP_008610173.1 hypothetical protein SDRG_06187 [Saprolegnia diclina VS20]